MKELFLKWVYEKNRSYFYAQFVQETIGEVPMNISEPAMTFLAQGKDKITKWTLYWIGLIQRRIVTEKKDIEIQQGMILALKIFMQLVNKQVMSKPREPIKTEPKVDHLAEVEAAISGLRKLSTSDL